MTTDRTREADILADVLDDHRPQPMPDPDLVKCLCDGTVWERPDWRRHVGAAMVAERDNDMAAEPDSYPLAAHVAAVVEEGKDAEIERRRNAAIDVCVHCGDVVTNDGTDYWVHYRGPGSRINRCQMEPYGTEATPAHDGAYFRDEARAAVDVAVAAERERIGAAIRLAQPDHLTPMGARIIEQALGGDTDG